MPLRKTDRYRAWLARGRPTIAARLIVAEFLLRASAEPWAAPSVPVPDLSDQPVSEMRLAVLTVPGEPPLTVYYRRTYATEDVDVIDIAGSVG